MTAALACEGVAAGYHPLTVVRDLDLEVRRGEVVALVGPNGAGKTTLLLTLAGFLPALGGTITLHGRSLAKVGPEKTVRAGMVLVPDDRCLFSGLTVREHLGLARRKDGLPEAEVLDHFPALEPRLDTTAGNLSGGEQQMLALGRALVQRPQVLLIDELSTGLAPLIVERLLATLRRIAEGGTAVLFVEQHVRLAFETADQAVVMVHGEVVLRGDPQALLDDPTALEQAYLGAGDQPPM